MPQFLVSVNLGITAGGPSLVVANDAKGGQRGEEDDDDNEDDEEATCFPIKHLAAQAFKRRDSDPGAADELEVGNEEASESPRSCFAAIRGGLLLGLLSSLPIGAEGIVRG